MDVDAEHERALRTECEELIAAARREGVIEGLEMALVRVNELRRDNCSLAEARTWLRAELAARRDRVKRRGE